MKKTYWMKRRPLRRLGLFRFPSGYASVADYVNRFLELNYLTRS